MKGHNKGQGKSKSKGKGKWTSKGRKGFQSGRQADSLEFEEESWEETNETEQEKWWNSWTEDVEPKRDGAPGGTELELNSFKTASGEILPDEGQLMWPCFLQDGRKCWLRGCSQASDLSRQGVHSSGGSILSWNSPTGNLISRAMTKGTRQARSDEPIKLYKENNIYNFYVKGFDGNWQAQNFDTGAAVSVLPRSRRVSAAVVGRQSAGSVRKSRFQAVRPIAVAASSPGSRGEQNTDMDVVTELREPVQARAEMNAEEYREFGASPSPICSGRSRGR